MATEASENVFPKVIGAEQGSTPATPGSGQRKLYAKSDGWYDLDDAGTETGPFGGAPSAAAVEIGVACSDESTAIDATGTKATFRMPCAMTVTGVRASLTGATTTGTVTVDVNDGGTTILSTKVTIDATEKTSTTAATPAVISDSALADDAEITVDVDDVGDSTATGLKVWLIGTRA